MHLKANTKLLIYILNSIATKEDEYTINIRLPIVEINYEFVIFTAYIDDIKKLLEDFKKFTGITDVNFNFAKFDSGTDWVSILISGVVGGIAKDVVLKIILFLWQKIYLIYEEKRIKELHLEELEVPDKEKIITQYIATEITKQVNEYIKNNYEQEKDIYKGKVQNEIQKALEVVCEQMILMHEKGFKIEPSLNPPVFLVSKDGVYQIDEKEYKKIISQQKTKTESIKQLDDKSTKK